MDRASERGMELGDVWFRFVFPRILSPKRMWKLQKEKTQIWGLEGSVVVISPISHGTRHWASSVITCSIVTQLLSSQSAYLWAEIQLPGTAFIYPASASTAKSDKATPLYTLQSCNGKSYILSSRWNSQLLQPLFTPPSLVSLTQHTISHTHFGYTPLHLLFIRLGVFKEIHGGWQCFPHN